MSSNINFQERAIDGNEPRDTGLPTLMACVQLVWHAKFPMAVVQKLVTTKNPHGTITNSNLELAALILQKDTAACHFDVHSKPLCPVPTMLLLLAGNVAAP
jgi:hypothetical protein